MENIRNRVDIQLVNNEGKAMKLAAKPNYKHCTIFDENLIAVHMKKTKIRFDQTGLPGYVYPRLEQNLYVRLPLQLHQEEVWG